jgi:hypothetical protein
MAECRPIVICHQEIGIGRYLLVFRAADGVEIAHY